MPWILKGVVIISLSWLTPDKAGQSMKIGFQALESIYCDDGEKSTAAAELMWLESVLK
jgi:hypothetical protein